MLGDVAGHIEDQQIRNRGTIGGNCCLGDPTNNLPPLLIALGARMNIQGARGMRHVAAEDFFFAFFSTAVEQGEILRSITRPAASRPAPASDTSRSRSAPTPRRIVRAAAYVRANGTIEDVRVVLAVVGPEPIRHTSMEQRLRGGAVSAEAVAAASEAIGEDIDAGRVTPTASADYRRRMARVVARRAVNEAIERGASR